MKTRIRPDSHAVVAGAGIAGLLAARVLSERFTHVSVVEKDDPRAPEDRHPHLLLARG